jgi:ribosomal protein S18 acetylase RimI-like enzyme
MGENEMPIRIELHDGPRGALRTLFEEADDSAAAIESYLGQGRILVAVEEVIVGHLQLTETDSPDVLEIKSTAVLATHRRRGIGRQLIEAALAVAREEGRRLVRVGTATADIGNLRFYQRLGFRLRSIERDAFAVENGYPPGMSIDGIPLADRVWLDRGT